MVLQCRACLSTQSETYIDMNTSMAEGDSDDNSYMEYFQRCTRLSIDDQLHFHLPATICSRCARILQMSCRFVKVAQQADAVLRANLNVKVIEPVEEEPEMERLELLEESEAEEEECVLEELVEDDGGFDEMEFMEVETVEEHIVEDLVEEEEASSQHSEVEEKPQLEEFIDELLPAEETLPSVVDSSVIKKEHLSNAITEHADAAIDATYHYPVDELDDEYLVEFNDDEKPQATKPTSDSNESTIEPSARGFKWKCIICKRVLRGDVSYEGHMNMHKQLRPYKCDQCSGAFRCKKALERHETIRHDSAQHVQQQQDNSEEQTSSQNNEIEDHETISQDSTQHVQQQRENCEEQTSSKNNEIEEDIEKEKEATFWQCDIRKRQMRSESTLRAQQKTHQNEHECSVCTKRFASAYTLRTHMRNLHSTTLTTVAEKDGGGASGEDGSTDDTVVQCELCKKKLLRQNVAKHAAMHERKQQAAAAATAAVDGAEQTKFMCAHCPRECKNRKLLYQHERMHDGETPGIVFVCDQCERQYATQHLLTQHHKQAHKERDNICPICGNAFKLKNQLVNHMKLHLEKNIQCPHCEKRYARQFDLNVHLRTHTGELPYACHLCEKRFAIKVRLTYHLQKHEGIKHPCKECGAEFNSKQKLKAHSFKHSGMPYRCEMCDDHGFANRDVFKRHLMRVHHATMNDEELVEMFQRNTGKTTRIRPIEELKHVVVHTQEENEEGLINDEDIAMESEVVHT